MRCELLIDTDMASRGRRMLEAMAAAAPIEIKVRVKYRGDCDVLMIYGTGHPIRGDNWRRHRKLGGRCVGWDLGYWARSENETFTMRATIDDHHPWRLMRPEPPERWAAAGVQLRDEADPAGPIVLVGLGPKACRAHRLAPLQWESAALRHLRAVAPGRPVVFKRKRRLDKAPAGVDSVSDAPIEEVLRGASLVMCRHSNVAVDATIAGVPVVCEDGAARYLYTGPLSAPTVPDREQRLAFMQSLAWWQWKPDEAAQAWNYLLSRLG
jgi:hypothetical protein